MREKLNRQVFQDLSHNQKKLTGIKKTNYRMKLSIQDSNVLKGVAILIMLWHHLFLRPEYNDIVIHGHSIAQEIAIMCKVCVAIFVFVSGYGLTEKLVLAPKQRNKK